MKVGDRVKFVGDMNGYKSAFHRILKREGLIIKIADSNSFYSGKIQVRWTPKTKRGSPEISYHAVDELEIISSI